MGVTSHHQPEAIVLDLVNPTGTAWRVLGGRWKAGFDEAGRCWSARCTQDVSRAGFWGTWVWTKSLILWSERRDLNPGPPVPQTGALTGLRYAPSGATTINSIATTRNKSKAAAITSITSAIFLPDGARNLAVLDSIATVAQDEAARPPLNALSDGQKRKRESSRSRGAVSVNLPSRAI